jgi:N-acetylmuramate 1-kinase
MSGMALNSTISMIAFARDALGLPFSVSMDIVPLSARGSDRVYFRLTWGSGDSAILVDYNPDRKENCYFCEIAWFLREIGVSVPQILHHDPTAHLVLQEDIGNADLYGLRKAPSEQKGALYQKTLETVHRLHSFPEEAFPFHRVKLMKSFGYDLYRWERDYFKEHFVKGVCAVLLDRNTDLDLEAELAGLAERLSSVTRSLIHRDLQSQNIMIRAGEPFLIDFQGMRFGNGMYDIASLLCDPYVDLANEERIALLEFYYNLSPKDMDWAAFQHAFWEASAQRLMQALGAYGFLGSTRGLTHFLGHIPSGLNNLLSAVTHTGSMPVLGRLCQTCGSVLAEQSFKET